MKMISVFLLCHLLLIAPALAQPDERQHLLEDLGFSCSEFLNAQTNVQTAINEYGNNLMSPEVVPYFNAMRIKQERLTILAKRYRQRYGEWPETCLIRKQKEYFEKRLKPR
jgi:hypothetical protein